MDARLRAWVTTGDYAEPEEPHFDRPPGGIRRSPSLRENLAVGVLVPLGVVVGALLAGACLLRFLTLPLANRTRARSAPRD